jgi:hypothetical protein
MGADIHSHVEVFRDGAWRKATGNLFPTNEARYGERPDEPFPHRNYRMFGFLAGVRDHDIPPITQPRGLPDDVSPEVRADHGPDDVHDGDGYFSASWLTVAELLDEDPYDRTFLSAEGTTTVRDYLDEWFFERVAELTAIGDPKLTRVVFWFDT